MKRIQEVCRTFSSWLKIILIKSSLMHVKPFKGKDYFAGKFNLVSFI